MSQAIEGYGTIFSISPDGVTYTAVSEVAKLSFNNAEGLWIDVTHLLSPGGFREFIPGLVDAGEVKLDLNWIKTQYSTLAAKFRTGVTWFKITFTTGSTFVYQGGLKSLGGDIPKDDKISNTATFKVTGNPTFTP